MVTLPGQHHPMQHMPQMPPQMPTQVPQQMQQAPSEVQGVPDHRPPINPRTGLPRVPNDIGEPSQVIHCRNVTADVTQSNLVGLFQRFGRVVNVVMLRARNQALIELDTIEGAQRCIEHFCLKGNGHAEIDGRRVWVKYSRHTSLSETPPGKTLLVSMFNPGLDISTVISINPNCVFQIFGNYGPVEKILILPKNQSSAQNHNRVQALVQYDAQETAERVKAQLQGQPVNLGDVVSFFLDIQFSKVTEISCQTGTSNSMVIPKGFTPLLQQQQQVAQMQQQQIFPQPGFGMGAPTMPQYGMAPPPPDSHAPQQSNPMQALAYAPTHTQRPVDVREQQA
eukprot:Hpha_TRINITY_DN16145_c1_g2::TRINITY_DN16145_c1_g2_i3::g.6549::m.6549